MSERPYILLPPSEGKRPGGQCAPVSGPFDSALTRPRRQVIAALRRLIASHDSVLIERALQVRGPLLDRAMLATKALTRGRGKLLPVWERYTGVVWAHLEPDTLTSEQRRRLLVPSGLYGLSAGEDRVADYRLKMDATLAGLGPLAPFWRAHLSDQLVEHVRGATLVNLLPREHEAALHMTAIARACRLVTVEFVSADGGRAVGHGAKAVKGVLARSLLDQGTMALEDFAWEGWHTQRDSDLVRIFAPA